MHKIFIDGREGTTGLRISERIAGRDGLQLLTLPEEKRKDTAARREMLNSADLSFLCLPDAAAREAAALIENPRARVIDASTAHRTSPGWDYGFPELSDAHRAAIARSRRTANPGCHATGFIAIVYPLIEAGILPRGYPLACTSVTGYSGGGKSMIAAYTDENRPPEYDSPRQYGLGQSHKHIPEMVSVCGLERTPLFMPILADYYSGMVVTVPLFTDMLCKKTDPRGLRDLLSGHYSAPKSAVRVLPFDPAAVVTESGADAFAGSNNLSGRDDMEIIVTGNNDRAVISARFDNLGKGASGAAVQCMNIMLGLDEFDGLVI